MPQVRAFWLTVCKTVGPGRLNQVRQGANMRAMSYVLPHDVVGARSRWSAAGRSAGAWP